MELTKLKEENYSNYAYGTNKKIFKKYMVLPKMEK